MQVDRGEHAAAVVGLPHDLEALGAREHHPQARAHERVVVDEQDADHGSSARRTWSPPSARPVRELAAGERDALGEPDQPGAAAGRRRAGRGDADGAAADDLDDQPAGRSSRAATVTVTAAAGACLRAFVRPSWTIR